MRPGYQTGGTLGEFLARLLDRGFQQSAGQVLAAVSNAAERPALQAALDALAADLVARGQRALAPRSAAYRALTAELTAMTQRQAAALHSGAPYVMDAARQAAAASVPELALWGTSAAQSASIRAAWNTPDVAAVQALLERTRLPAFDAALARFGEGTADAVRAVALRGLVTGQGPLALARAMRRAVADVPRYQANTLMRTLQMTSYREATAVHQSANSHLIEKSIRIAALDNRTCLGCLALHGTEVPVGEPIAEHHNGRCIVVSQVRGRVLNVQTGEDWLRSLPEARQVQIMGPGKFAAWQAGAVQLRDFAVPHTDPVFGAMVHEASLRGLLGDRGASQYYARNQRSGAGTTGTTTGPNLDTATTIQDLRDFMSRKYPWIAFDPSVQGIRDTEQTFAHWREAISEIDRLATRYPEEMRRLQAVRGQRAGDRRSRNALATSFWGSATSPIREIVFRNRLMSDPDALQSYPNPNTFGGVFVLDLNEVRTTTCHECGHIVDFPRAFRGNTSFSRPPDIGERTPLPIDGARVGGTIQQMRSRFIDAVRSPRRSNTLSQYGMSDPYEVMAEAFVAREYIPESEWTQLMQVFDQYMQSTDLSQISAGP